MLTALQIYSKVCSSAVLVYSLCWKRRQKISRQQARAPRRDSPEEIEKFLQQLKDHEFACHDIT